MAHEFIFIGNEYVFERIAKYAEVSGIDMGAAIEKLLTVYMSFGEQTFGLMHEHAKLDTLWSELVRRGAGEDLCVRRVTAPDNIIKFPDRSE